MTDLTRVTATFAIAAGGYGEGDLDVTGLTPDEIADLIMELVAVDPTLCHQCADEMSDPQIEELTGFRVGRVEYEKVGDHWVVAS